MEEQNSKRRPLQIGLRTLFEIVALLAIALAWVTSRDSSGANRYQLHSYTPPYEKVEQLILIDTQTGECWQKSGGGWSGLVNPLPKQ